MNPYPVLFAAMLTGMNADRVGVPGVIRTHAHSSWGYFDPKVPTLADELKRAGYHTSLIGKWHLGLESPNTPNERGFALFQDGHELAEEDAFVDVDAAFRGIQQCPACQ